MFVLLSQLLLFMPCLKATKNLSQRRNSLLTVFQRTDVHGWTDRLLTIGSFDSIWVAAIRFETRTDFCPVFLGQVTSTYRLVELDNTGPVNAQPASVLEVVEALGGKRYKLCFRETGKLSLEAEYVIDKIVRRTTKVWTIGHYYAISEYDAVTQA